MQKLIIYDFFGGGCNSLSQAINDAELNDVFKVFTFDCVEQDTENQRGAIYDFQTYIQTDLSRPDLVDFVKSLNLPAPDIITASPLCQSFSVILSMKGGGTCFWKPEQPKSKNCKLVERSIEEFNQLNNRKLNAEKQLFTKRLGERCAANMCNIIKEFKPRAWYIENPATSLIFQYIRYNQNIQGLKNVCTYSAYGFPTQKPTAFYSNIYMPLKTSWTANPCGLEFSSAMRKTQKRKTLKSEPFSNLQQHEANDNSKIPSELLQEILKRFLVVFEK